MYSQDSSIHLLKYYYIDILQVHERTQAKQVTMFAIKAIHNRTASRAILMFVLSLALRDKNAYSVFYGIQTIAY